MDKIFKYKGKIIGEIHGNVFSKVVDPSKHFMRLNKSWGIDLKTFEQLPPDCKIVLHDVNTSEVHLTDWQTYADNGTVEDYGYGRQIFLNKDKFHKDDVQKLQ